jgi:hypothetical protein
MREDCVGRSCVGVTNNAMNGGRTGTGTSTSAWSRVTTTAHRCRGDRPLDSTLPYLVGNVRHERPTVLPETLLLVQVREAVQVPQRLVVVTTVLDLNP